MLEPTRRPVTRSRALSLFAGCGLLIAISLPLCAVAETPRLLKRDWIEVESTNFLIRSALSEKETLELAADLELFRHVVFFMTNVADDASPVPTRIFMLKERSDIAAFGADSRKVGGFFMPGVRNNLIVMGAVGDWGQHVIQHEYVHFLLRNATGIRYPSWFDEGFAELMASTRVKRDKVFVGDVPPGRAAALKYVKWMHINKVLTREGYDHWPGELLAMYYAESWLAVHYLQFGRPERVFPNDMKTYLGALEAGVPPLKAFEQGFGLTSKTFDRRVRKYGENKIKGYTIPRSAFPAVYETSTRKLEKAEIAVALAQATLQLDLEKRSQRFVSYALKHDPSAAGAWAVKGDWLKFDRKYEEALPYFEKALELAPNDPHIVLDMGEFWLDRAKDEDTKPEQRAEWLAEARKAFVRAWKLDDTLPEVYEIYGLSYLIDNSNPKKAVEMLSEASFLLPSNLEIRYELATAHVENGDQAVALELFRSVEVWAHSDSPLGTGAGEMVVKLLAGAAESAAAGEAPDVEEEGQTGSATSDGSGSE